MQSCYSAGQRPRTLSLPPRGQRPTTLEAGPSAEGQEGPFTVTSCSVPGPWSSPTGDRELDRVRKHVPAAQGGPPAYFVRRGAKWPSKGPPLAWRSGSQRSDLLFTPVSSHFLPEVFWNLTVTMRWGDLANTHGQADSVMRLRRQQTEGTYPKIKSPQRRKVWQGESCPLRTKSQPWPPGLTQLT